MLRFNLGLLGPKLFTFPTVNIAEGRESCWEGMCCKLDETLSALTKMMS